MTEKIQSRIIFGLLVFGVTLLLCLGLLEAAFRIMGAYPGYLAMTDDDLLKVRQQGELTYPPTRKVFSLTCDHRPALGHENYRCLGISMRDYDDYSWEKPPGTWRILGIGDSFAWGWGVFDNRRTMFKLLECWATVMKQDAAGKIEVINAAQPGVDIDYYGEFLRDDGYRMSPDLVLIVLNLNDVNCYHASVPSEANAVKLLRKTPDMLSRISKLYEFVRFRIQTTRISRQTTRDYHDSYFGPKRDLWLHAQKVLLRIRNQCRARQIRLVVTIFPLLYGLDEGNYPFSQEVTEIEAFLRRSEIPVHNLLPEFRGKKSSLLWTWPADAHPNETAHRIAAESLYRYLKDRQFLPVAEFEK
jgi:hypothetical protein